MTNPTPVSATRIGSWQQTFLGKQFWPLDPRPEDVHAADIAHALSNQCRFGGHCQRFYSVAQHSVHVSYNVPPEDALWGLLHDGSEAYVIDVPRPLKRHLQGYMEIEAKVMQAICDKFGLPHEMPESVKVADEVLLVTEKRDLTGPEAAPWTFNRDVKPLPMRIEPWAPGIAKERFLKRLWELT